ncbi:MAG: hypothetical protein AAF755_07000 [Pseudomonadota bacterium]
MSSVFRPAAFATLLALAACDQAAVGGGTNSFVETRGINSCIRAVERETGVEGATLNTTLAVVELYQYIIDVPNARPWTCFTDENGRAVELLEVRRA